MRRAAGQVGEAARLGRAVCGRGSGGGLRCQPQP